MTTENEPIFDILVTDAPGGKLTKVGTAWPTAKGTGTRFTLKVGLPAGAQLLILPSRVNGARESEPQTAEAMTS